VATVVRSAGRTVPEKIAQIPVPKLAPVYANCHEMCAAPGGGGGSFTRGGYALGCYAVVRDAAYSGWDESIRRTRLSRSLSALISDERGLRTAR